MHNKTNILHRKLFHLGLILPIAIFWYIWIYEGREFATTFYFLFISGFVGYEYLRLDTHWILPFRSFIKPQEENTIVDGLHLVLVIGILHWSVSFPVAVAATLVALIGDTVSTMGGLYGTMKVFKGSKNKTTWEGVLAGLIINGIIIISILGINSSTILAIAMSVIVEAITIRMDDNIAVPLSVAFFATLNL